MRENETILRINQAIDHINRNLDKNLTAEEIADYCCFSRFYFSRVFKSVVGEGLYSFIKRVKLESAAFQLRSVRRKPITDIALEFGYSPSNFATAFKAYFGMSASDYRKTNEVPVKNTYLSVVEHIAAMKSKENFFEEVNSRIRIRRFGSMLLEYERFIGNYSDLNGVWEGFCVKMGAKYGLDRDTRFVGISYDDPLIADENRCIYDMCIQVEKASGTNVHRIGEGEYACYEFIGNQGDLSKAYNEIFALWMPYCRYEPDNRFPLEIYHSVDPERGSMHLDICIPVR